MSQKGNFAHNELDCGYGRTLDDSCIIKVEDHNYPDNSCLDLCESSTDNVEYINLIQDGFQQTDMLCEYVCGDTDLDSDDMPMDNPSLETKSDSHIKFPDSPGTSFSCKIGSFSTIDGLVHGFDEHLDNYILDGIKERNKTHVENDDHSTEIEQDNRDVDSISTIAKGFGFEDLLPGDFSVTDTKGTVEPESSELCEDENDNISVLTLTDFEKCSALNSPSQCLDFEERLNDSQCLELNALDMLASPPCQLEEDSAIASVNPKVGYGIQLSGVENANTMNNTSSCTIPDKEIPGNNLAFDDKINEANIPIVSITEVDVNNQNYAAGTFVITQDQVSKKVQIVLSLEEGQQVYDINADSIPADPAFDVNLRSAIIQKTVSNVDDSVAVTSETSGVLPPTAVQPQLSGGTFNSTTVNQTYWEVLPHVLSQRIRKSKSSWMCPIPGCGQIVHKESKLRVHMLSHRVDRRPFKCKYVGCDWAFTTPYRLHRHMKTHGGSKEHICDVEGCNRKFTTIYNLNTHKKRHKWPRYLPCPSENCDKTFENRRQLELHLRVHKEIEAPYKCTMCEKRYYSANCITSHYRTHQYAEDGYKCPFPDCNKQYDKVCRLRQHVRHHTGDRPYVCPAKDCKWSFMSASKLTRHMRKHTGERKFMCTVPGCGKSFMRPEHLKGHVVIHSGDKPFHCPHENCNAKFTARSSLYVHVKKHCPSILKVVYPCPMDSCLKKYNSKSTLKQHLQKCHSAEMDDVKNVVIKKKLELTMPVSRVKPSSDNSLEYLELDNSVIADDPLPNFTKELLQSSIDPLADSSSSLSTLTKKVPKPTKEQKSAISNSSVKKSNKSSTKASESKVKSLKVVQSNLNGCARTDFCFNLMTKKTDPSSFIYLNQNSIDNNDSKSFLLNGHTSEIKSLDVMLTSSVLNDSESLIKNVFLSDDCSITNSLYHDDSDLVGTSSFSEELIPVSLLSGDVDTEESSLNCSSEVFSAQTGVDEFSSILD